MDKELKKCRNLINKIVKKLGRADLDWTIQLSISSIHPEKIAYCAQIEAPANGLQPITFVKNSYEELEKSLTLAEKGLDQKAVEKAYFEAEVERAKEKQKFFEEKIKELEEESNADREEES